MADKTLHQPCQHRLLEAAASGCRPAAADLLLLQRTGSQCSRGQATKPNLGVALHHDVIDVGLQRHADVLALLGIELEDVQHASHTHLEEDCLAAAAKLHDVTQLCRVQVLLGNGPEEVHASLVDAQDQLGRQQPDGVLYALHCEEDRVACRVAAGLVAKQCWLESTHRKAWLAVL